MTLRCLLVLLIFSLAAVRARAGAPLDPLAGADAIVATVKEVSPEEATNGNPAKVTVEITETLKGQLKGTVVVLWSGPFHGLDCVGPATNPAVTRWAAEKAEKPKVGDTYILFVTVYRYKNEDGHEWQRLDTEPVGRMPLTEEHRQQAIKIIKVYDDSRKAEAERRAAEAAVHAAQVRRWRAGMPDKKLVAAIRDADFVALGRVSSNNYTFKVSEVLKGRGRLSYTDDSYFVELAVTKEVAAVLDRESEYVLLLSEKGLVLEPSVLVYQPLGDGMVLADAAAVKLAREATKGLAGRAPPAVLVYPDYAPLAGPLETAAAGKVTVIRDRSCPPMDKIAERSGVKAEFYLSVVQNAERKPATLQLKLARSNATQTLLIDTTLTGPDEKSLAGLAAEIVAAILKAQ